MMMCPCPQAVLGGLERTLSVEAGGEAQTRARIHLRKPMVRRAHANGPGTTQRCDIAAALCPNLQELRATLGCAIERQSLRRGSQAVRLSAPYVSVGGSRTYSDTGRTHSDQVGD